MNNPEVGKIIYSEEAIRQRVKDLAEEITVDHYPRYQRAVSKNQRYILILVGVLNGSVVFLADLARAVNDAFSRRCGHEVGFVAWDAVSVSTRGKNNEQQKLRWLLDPKMSLFGRDVVAVEDIVHTGKTAQEVMSRLRVQNPASLKLCTLLDRVSEKKAICPDYVGFELEGNAWVIGYGLDTNKGFYRGLRYIAVYNHSGC